MFRTSLGIGLHRALATIDRSVADYVTNARLREAAWKLVTKKSRVRAPKKIQTSSRRVGAGLPLLVVSWTPPAGPSRSRSPGAGSTPPHRCGRATGPGAALPSGAGAPPAT